MHVRRTARDVLFPAKEDDVFFARKRGDLVFRDNASVRTFADRINRGERRSNETMLRPAEVGAMALVHELLHAALEKYRAMHPASFERFARMVDEALDGAARKLVLDFLTKFPPPPVYRTFRGDGDDTPETYLERTERVSFGFEVELEEELILLWVTNQNPAYEPVRTLVSDHELGHRYQAFILEAKRFFDDEPRFGPKGESLVDLLLAPGAAHPTSIFAQLEYIGHSWGKALGLDQHPAWERMSGVQDLKKEEDRYFARGGPGPGEPLLETMKFGKREAEEPAQFSPDLNWMPNVVLLAKSVYVWLDQLGKKYGRYIRTLDQVPDEELDQIASRNITGLWLIGLFERSPASRKIKQMRGDEDALASAYSLKAYEIASELGGVAAYDNLRSRAWQRGIRLAADMVPNHVGIDADWVVHHPDWFLQAPTPPFPAYRFNGPDLSTDPRIGVFLEQGYWSMTDAAVVYRRHDNWTGEDRFIYHGNDGTAMPWNDTAQLDYSKPEVRRAVIETILHVASMFPIIRFDAAMTLAKRHVQRLWFPLPGSGDAIPSRADYAMTQEEFDETIPIEFWREVVDTVAARAPDTLLLAEAFWMMEGYFVRTLGMHRVYNSAFMNMLKRQENEKYRATITNVLDFDPEILKRFVNFMNNPDEETAVAQFGNGDRYFGVCSMMCTMPGLPMFGHGQIEGLHEKYGMEYRRARWDEWPNDHLIRRHEREIFPILAKRHLFSGVEHFALYDFVTEGGFVDQDVYAYSNGAGSERALVLFNNKFKTTRGRIFASTHRGPLGQQLDLDEDRGAWLVIRDIPHGLEYLRTTSDMIDGGMAWELDAFQYHVLSGFKPVNATLERPYHRLAVELGGRGVPDVEKAVRELYLRPLHGPLREACSKLHREYLAAQLDAPDDTAGRNALEERLRHVADGFEWMLTQRAQREVSLDREPAIQSAGNRFASLYAFLHRAASPKAKPSESAVEVAVSGSKVQIIPAPGSTAPSMEDVEPDVDTERDVEKAAEEAERSRGAEEALPISGIPVALSRTSEPSVESAAPDTIVETVQNIPAAEPAKSSAPVVAESLFADDHANGIAEPEPSDNAAGSVITSVLHVDLLLAWIQVEAVMDLITAGDVALEEARSRPPAYLSTLAGRADPSQALFSNVPSEPALSEPRALPSSEPRMPPATTSHPSLSSGEALPSEPRAPAASAAQAVFNATWASRERILAEWELAIPVLEGFATGLPEDEAKRRAALVILAATLPSGPLAPALRLAIGSPRGQAFLNVHQSDGTWWLNKEAFEDLSRFLAEREIASGAVEPAVARADAESFNALAEREGYRAKDIAAKLGPTPREDVVMRTSSPSLEPT
jgi:glycosidase